MSTLNLANLTVYTNQLSGIFLSEAINKGQTFREDGGNVSIQPGIKYADSINLMSTTLVAQAGACGAFTTGTGSVTLSQRDITVCALKVEQSYCVTDLEKYWAGRLAKIGSYNESGPLAFEEVYTKGIMDETTQLIEDIFWRGSTDGTYGTGNLALCNGILHILENTAATASVVAYGTASGALTVANAITVFDEMYALTPNDVIGAGDLTMYMSDANFTTLMRAARVANYFTQFDGATGYTRVVNSFLNTNVRVVSTRGLNGRNEIILTPSSNLFFGTDDLNDPTAFRAFYDESDDRVKLRIKWKQGAQVAFPQYVVIKTA
jgi:hypothetical protein